MITETTNISAISFLLQYYSSRYFRRHVRWKEKRKEGFFRDYKEDRKIVLLQF